MAPRSTTQTWRLAEADPGDRDERWREIVSSTHLPWTLDVDRHDRPADPCSVVRRRLGDLDVVETRCGPCGGRRLRSDVRRTEGDYIGVLVVVAGREVVSDGDDQVVLGPGEAAMWRSDRPLRFDVLDPLHKRTLLIPLARFRDVVPRPDVAAARLLPATPSRDLLVHYLGLLAGEDLDASAAVAAGDAALDLVGAVVARRSPPDDAGRHADLFRRSTSYIEAHLADPDLTPHRIASAHDVSDRLLYSAFEAEGDSIAAYVRRRRLARAHADLTRLGPTVTVRQVARRWGFDDPAHFTRAFHAQYGLAPVDVRDGRPG